MTGRGDVGEEYLETIARPLREGLLRLDQDYGGLLAKIERRFPIVGTTIDWNSVPSAVSSGALGLPNTRQQFQLWFSAISEAKELTGQACVVGDGPVEVGVVGSIGEILDKLPDLTNLPQHTYVISYPDCDWCACLSFEGWMDFGFAAKSQPRSPEISNGDKS